MMPAGSTKLVENLGLMQTTGALLAGVNAGRGLAFGEKTHGRARGNRERGSRYCQTPRSSPRRDSIRVGQLRV